MRISSFIIAMVMIIGMAGVAFAQTNQTQGLCPCVSTMTPIKVSGKIESTAFPMAVLKTSKGESYTLRLGPWWFWQDRGYKLSAGENVEVEGFQSGDFIVPSVIKGAGKEIRLRDQNGYPLWGRGPRGKGR